MAERGAGPAAVARHSWLNEAHARTGRHTVISAWLPHSHRIAVMMDCCECDCCDLVPILPLEIQEKIFFFLPPNLRTLCMQGHILVTQDATVSLPSGLSVRVFGVGGGSGAVIFQ